MAVKRGYGNENNGRKKGGMMDLEICRDFKELARLTDMLNTERNKTKRRAIWRQIGREFVNPEVHLNCIIVEYEDCETSDPAYYWLVQFKYLTPHDRERLMFEHYSAWSYSSAFDCLYAMTKAELKQAMDTFRATEETE